MAETELPDQFLYSRKGPWPQPSPSHPLICADEVLNIPPIENLLFSNTIGKRYLESQIGYAPAAAAYAAMMADWKGVTPERLDTIMLKTLYTRFTVPMTKDEKDACTAAFKGEPAILQEIATGTWYKYDFTAMDMVHPLKGMHVAPTKLFIRRGTDGAHCKIIEVGGVHVYRTDSSFGIATLYALQGAAYHVLFVVHPALHFPMDSVNAITKTSVPMGHPLFQLFLPHSAYSLPLDNGVLESSASVVNNNAQGTRFDPLTADAYSLKLLFGAGYSGLGPKYRTGQDQYDSVAYPKFDYMQPRMYDPKDTGPNQWFDSEYGAWLADYFKNAFLPFGQAIATYIKTSKDDSLRDYVRTWARYLSTHVNGFPTPDDCIPPVGAPDNDKLGRALAIYIWNNSVSHGGDHWSFANEITAVEKCLRLRRPPPATRTEDPVDNTKQLIFSPNDMQRAALGQYMFFQAWAIEPNLIQTEYAFTDAALLGAVKTFHAALKTVNTARCKRIPFSTDPTAPTATTTCQPLEPLPDEGQGKPAVPYERTIPQSIQY